MQKFKKGSSYCFHAEFPFGLGDKVAKNAAIRTAPGIPVKNVAKKAVRRLPIVRYCLSVYGASSITQRIRLQKTVRFTTRAVSGCRKYDHVSTCSTNSAGYMLTT